MCWLVSTQLTRMMSTVQASNSVNSMSPAGYGPDAGSWHWFPGAGFRLTHCPIGSAGSYWNRSRHFASVPSFALGQFAFTPVGDTVAATRRNVPRLHSVVLTICPVCVEMHEPPFM